MVSKRQRLAKKRFKEANPDLFPKPESPKHDDSIAKAKKKKHKLNKIKVKTLKKKVGSGKSLGKHPLRVLGMRPGESCFICKSSGHLAKLCPEKAQWEKNKICLLCRQRGHSLKHCPKQNDNNDKKFCYNCGEAGHSLSKCSLPLQDGGTKFAECFICKERGHLSKNCPKNTRGIYPKGGSCKVCGEVTHLAKNCPNKGNKAFVSSTELTAGDHETAQGVQRTVFQSGDNLEDDFMVEDMKRGKNDATSQLRSDLSSAEDGAEEKAHVKPKKRKQGPKVVNFFS